MLVVEAVVHRDIDDAPVRLEEVRKARREAPRAEILDEGPPGELVHDAMEMKGGKPNQSRRLLKAQGLMEAGLDEGEYGINELSVGCHSCLNATTKP